MEKFTHLQNTTQFRINYLYDRLMNNVKPRLVLLVGIPASGKSSFASKFNNDPFTVLSTDTIREELYGDVAIQGPEAWKVFHVRLKDLVRQRANIIIDNTNVNAKSRREILDTCKGYEVDYVVFSVPLVECLRRNAARARQVPEEVIRNMSIKLKNNLHLLPLEAHEITYLSN